jgi:hypothetical protein
MAGGESYKAGENCVMRNFVLFTDIIRVIELGG